MSVILTDLCALTRPVEGDAGALAALFTDPAVRRYLGGPIAPERLGAAIAMVTDGESWVVRWRGEAAAIGLVTLAPHHDGEHQEISYQFMPAVWGQGVAREVVGAVIDHALMSLNYPCLVAETQAANAASRRLLERSGMVAVRELERFGELQVLYSVTGRAGL